MVSKKNLNNSEWLIWVDLRRFEGVRDVSTRYPNSVIKIKLFYLLLRVEDASFWWRVYFQIEEIISAENVLNTFEVDHGKLMDNPSWLATAIFCNNNELNESVAGLCTRIECVWKRPNRTPITQRIQIDPLRILLLDPLKRYVVCCRITPYYIAWLRISKMHFTMASLT